MGNDKPPDPHVVELLARIGDVLEGETMGTVMMVVIAVMSNVIRQASPDERVAIIGFLNKHFGALPGGSMQ
jgi:hypothetical protein